MRTEYMLLLRFVLVGMLIIGGSWSCIGQHLIRGTVLDQQSLHPIAGATIHVPSLNYSSATDKDGHFSIKLDSSTVLIRINAMGYLQHKLSVKLTKDSTFQILLEEGGNKIEIVDITKRGKYKNNNPATELIDWIISQKRKNKLERKDSLYYEQYDKVKFGLVNPPDGLRKGLGNIGSFFANTDKGMFPGKETVTLFMQEEISDNFVKQHPSQTKKLVKSQQKTEFDPRYINNPNIQSYMKYIFQQVDIYDESLFFLNKLFLSPIADNAKLYYRYYVQDTIRDQKELYVRLSFEPRNKTDLLFKGDLIVALDGSYAVKAANLKVDDNANINWVNDIQLDLSYSKHQSGVMLQDTSHVVVSFGGRKDALFAERVSVNQQYNLNYTFKEGTFAGAPIEIVANVSETKLTHRPIQLNDAEALTYDNVEVLNNMKSFRTMMVAGYLLSQGYYSLGKFEIGPLEYLFHRNNLEGNRFRIGGRSTPLFSEKMYLEGYVAYGTKDEALKYYGKGAFSINGKSVTTFPAHYIEGSIQKDIFEPGKAIGYLKGDSFFRSFISTKPTKWLNTNAYRLGHVVEFGNHLSVATHFTHQRRQPIGDMQFVLSSDNSSLLKEMNTNDLQMVLRWAPKEKFYYRNMSRTTVKEKYPVFNLQYNRGFDGFWGSDYVYDAVRFSATKRFFMNQLGFGDATFSMGKIWGTLPYTLLEMPNIQELKDRHTISYDMTNSMEFAADQFIKFEYDHELSGFIFNKIPVLKKLKWRELIGTKLFYGKLSDHNNPYLSPDVVHFDTHRDGYLLTHVLDSKPYWEGVAGIDNIFRVFRVEYLRRLNYLYLPDVDKSRFRVSLHLNF